MIAKRFQSFRKLAIGTAAAMGLYMVTSQVAAERTELEKVERQILAAKQDIRQLQTELGTRANMRQLERWNGDVLALVTPGAAQFKDGTYALAALDRAAMPRATSDVPGAVQLAMAEAPAPVAVKPVVAKPDSNAAAPKPSLEERKTLVREAVATKTQLAALAGDRSKPDALKAKLLKTEGPRTP